MLEGMDGFDTEVVFIVLAGAEGVVFGLTASFFGAVAVSALLFGVVVAPQTCCTCVFCTLLKTEKFQVNGFHHAAKTTCGIINIVKTTTPIIFIEEFFICFLLFLFVNPSPISSYQVFPHFL